MSNSLNVGLPVSQSAVIRGMWFAARSAYQTCVNAKMASSAIQTENAKDQDMIANKYASQMCRYRTYMNLMIIMATYDFQSDNNIVY
ncbi:unnamed protein product [Strongylus vulgaris]|uniref:Uncharacterized protein n=1 Tax=Strongylus vulgaris TaxID=40348 RepID=A0A3P7K843_STRVU|nr:unnamed protein product [Strongylus vulgaris]